MINVHCACFGILGVQQHGRNFVSLLKNFDEIALFPWDHTPARELLVPEIQQALLNAESNVDENPGIGIGIMNRMGLIRGRYRVASIVWETTRIPECELAHLDNIDQIWIPSRWGRDLLIHNGLDARQIRIVPQGVNVCRFTPSPIRSGESASTKFRFLCVGKWEQRKGIEILIKAFCRAFRPDEAVELVLHCHNTNISEFNLQAEIENAAKRPHAPIRASYPVHDLEMANIYNSCDAFVLPSRGEGWGLPVIEAMACTLPVIVTNYSAYLDFVTPENAYLVNVEGMVDVDDPLNFDQEQDFGKWAEPDRAHLEFLLRHVFESREEAAQKGLRAREDIIESWTWQHAVSRAWSTLQKSLEQA